MVRLAIGIVCLVIVVTPFVFMKQLSDFSIKTVYGVKNKDNIKDSSNADIYYSYGFYQGLYLGEVGKKILAPDGYNINIVREALIEADKARGTATWKKSNVVFILSEAFSDIQNIDEVKFNKSLTPNIDKYSKDKDKIVMDLLVPTFGGASVNTEFEVLTAGSLYFMKSGFIPWTQYYNDGNGKHTPNIIREFNNNGYKTVYLTPWGSDSYRSKYVYSLFGTDEMNYNISGKHKRIYMSDEELVNAIYSELEMTSKDNLKFIMSASSENHYPYTTQYDKYDISIVETKLNMEDTDMLKVYAQGIYNADKALNDLYEKIKKLDVPTVVVFFGDHLPYTVDSNGNNPYLSSAYFNTASQELNNLRQYTTKAVILANYKLDIDELNYINASYLGAYVVNKMDLEISDYFKFVDYTRSIIPVFNRNVAYKNGSLIAISDLQGKMENQLNYFRMVQYNKFYDFN